MIILGDGGGVPLGGQRQHTGHVIAHLLGCIDMPGDRIIAVLSYFYDKYNFLYNICLRHVAKAMIVKRKIDRNS